MILAVPSTNESDTEQDTFQGDFEDSPGSGIGWEIPPSSQQHRPPLELVQCVSRRPSPSRPFPWTMVLWYALRSRSVREDRVAIRRDPRVMHLVLPHKPRQTSQTALVSHGIMIDTAMIYYGLSSSLGRRMLFATGPRSHGSLHKAMPRGCGVPGLVALQFSANKAEIRDHPVIKCRSQQVDCQDSP